jgi:hypothetical protein
MDKFDNSKSTMALEYSESGLLSRMRSVCNRYENIVRVLNDLLMLYIQNTNVPISRWKCLDLVTPIKHYDPKLYELIKIISDEDRSETDIQDVPLLLKGDTLPASTSLSAERVTHAEVVPPTLSPNMRSLQEVYKSISKDNQSLIEKWDVVSRTTFDYVCIRLYKLKGTKTLGTRDNIPNSGVFVTINNLVNSTLATDGDWSGETMTVPLSDSTGVQIDLRLETGESIAQSSVLRSEQLYQDNMEITLGTDWVLNVGIVLGISPSSIFPLNKNDTS